MSQNDKLFKDLNRLQKACNNIPKTIEKNMQNKCSKQLMQIGAKVIEEL